MSRRRRRILLLVPVLCGSPVALGQEPLRIDPPPGASVTNARFGEFGAVILDWNQDWSLEPDGTVIYRDHRRVKLLDRGPIRLLADPRIDVCVGQDELTIHQARTLLADGTVVEVPPYARNRVAANNTAGWPALACWQQEVISFSAVQPGSVLELDYEIQTRDSVFPWLSADLHLQEPYPVLQRRVRVTVPEGVPVRHLLDRGPAAPSPVTQTTQSQRTTYAWEFADLAPTTTEPQAPPWYERDLRLRFSTCPDATTWTSTIIDAVRRASEPTQAIREWARSVVAEELEPEWCARRLADDLRDTFNWISAPQAVRGWSCRPAAEVLAGGYGSALEAAALLTSGLKALGLEADLQVAVDRQRWDDALPVDPAFDGVVLGVQLPGQALLLHPQQGVLSNPGHWGQRWLLQVVGGNLQRIELAARGQHEPSEVTVAGRLTVDDPGVVRGELRIRLAGRMYDRREWHSAAAQQQLLAAWVGRIVTGGRVESASIGLLSDAALEATVQIASEAPLPRFANARLLQLGEGPLLLKGIELPLERTRRAADLRLDAVSENVDLVITVPADWAEACHQTAPLRSGGSWGVISQTVDCRGPSLQLHRSIEITQRTLTAEQFNELRRGLNDLRAPRYTNLLLGAGSRP